MFDLVGKRYWFFLLSGLIIVPGILSLVIFGLQLGIDFTGGSMLTISFNQPVEQAVLRSELISLGYGDAIIQRIGEASFIIRTPPLEEKEQQVKGALKDRFGPFVVEQEGSVGPEVAEKTVRYALYAMVAASVAILLYITFAFRKIPKPFRYGVCAIIALLHDVVVVVGLFSILGKLLNLEVNTMFVIGLLTIIGYSVNDTIVVFDRIRENMGRGTVRDFESVVNNSLLQSLGRSLNTSLTTLLVLMALFVLGGVTIRNFILVLLIGVISGTYSSVCIASQLLVVWENKEIGGLLRRITFVRQ